MSEYKVVEVEFSEQDILIESLEQMGYKPKIFENAANLHGYQGDKREQKAHIIIDRSQVGGSSNDVGFERVGEKFKLHASQYDKAWREGNKIKQLKQIYSEKRVTKTIKRSSKYSIVSRTEQEGKIKLQIKVRR